MHSCIWAEENSELPNYACIVDAIVMIISLIKASENA